MKKTLQTFVLLLVALLSVSAGIPGQLGDVNSDECVDINDVTSLIDYLLRGAAPLPFNSNADLDCDGSININDLTKLVDYLLGGSDLEPAEVKTYTVNGVTFRMVVVEGGTFTMGLTADVDMELSDYERKEEHPHEVTLPCYEIGQTEVTQELWQAVMGDNPSSVSPVNGYTEDLNRPVETVSWNDCQTFITKLNQLTGETFRLPTEAEWEFAARGGNLSQGYLLAGSNDLDEVALPCEDDDNIGMITHAVAAKKPNELGLYDMSGNVWEWCQDYFETYRPYAQYNPTGPSSGKERVMRGGYWFYELVNCRVSKREHGHVNQKGSFLGLRLAMGEDHSFRLSQDVVTVSVGSEATVDMLNGNGAYTVTGGSDSVSVSIDGDRLIVTGNQVGVSQVHVTDNATGAVRALRVIVATSVQTFTVNGVSFTMVGVEGGTFVMGAPDDDLDAEDDEKPAHEVTLSSYSIGQTEVTQELWVAVMGSNKSANVNEYVDHWTQPVDNLEWQDCQEFIVKLNQLTGKHFRLPTEAEWEFAARGGIHSKGFKYAGSNSIDDVAWYQGTCDYLPDPDAPYYAPCGDDFNSPAQPKNLVSLNGGNRAPIPWPDNNLGPQPVATKLPNELGLYDMCGNVVEYCQDIFGKYSSEAQTDPVCEDADYYRGTRGGNCTAYATQCRVTYRKGWYGWWNYGLRLVLDEENSTKFRLSETHLQLFIGESKTVNIFNGSGDYTITGDHVDVSVDGDRLTVTGKTTGISDLLITDNVTGLSAFITVHVYLDAQTICDEYGYPRFRMVSVKGGTFTMGATAEQGDEYQEDELPTHEVTLSDFYIGETEVSQGLWSQVTGRDPSHFHYEPPCEAPMRGGSSYDFPDISYDVLPVEQISWYDCQKFIAKLNMRTGKNFRLPTEAEWEYAARGGHLSRGYKYAGSDSINHMAWHDIRYGTYLLLFGDVNELGLRSMSGNVWEWCQDWYGGYSSMAQVNPSGPATGTNHVMRGGSWGGDSTDCRVSSRGYNLPDYWKDNLGMRLACDADGSPKFRLSHTVTELGEGESMTINILNGHGAYSYNVIEGENNVMVNLDGNTLDVKGTAEGVSIVRVTDNTTGASTDLVVVVVLEDEVFTVNGVKFKMKQVKGGSFMMGKAYSDDDNLKPVHQVTLSNYRIAETEVTQLLWEAVMGNNPSRFKGQPYNPVEQVSWNDCQEFIAKLNELTGRKFRLPTEAEWEYAARGGEAQSGYIYSGSNNINDVAWFYDNSYAVGVDHYNYGTHSVLCKSGNALGLYDMSGNVWEWCQDWYGNYSSDAQTNPTGPATGFYRVSRGGSWCNSAKYCEVTARNYGAPSYKEYYLGLRLAL
jgi:formylglycine-generating enzyme required for sulfatase activity